MDGSFHAGGQAQFQYVRQGVLAGDTDTAPAGLGAHSPKVRGAPTPQELAPTHELSWVKWIMS